MNKKSRFFRVIARIIVLLLAFEAVPIYAATMSDYCVVPPYVKKDVQPNVLILMDNSYIMGNQAYTDSYDSTKNYQGYFRTDLFYSYSGGQFVPDLAGVFSGKLLNWVTTSRYDLLESILVGGKSRSRQTNINTLVSMSNSWTKTYSNCIFQVSNGNLTITEAAANACILLDPARLTYNEDETKKLASYESNIESSYTVGALNIFFVAVNGALGLFTTEASASPLRISHISDQTITEGVAFSLTVTGNGGTESGYTWSAAGLPPGLSIGAAGTPITTISGTPTLAGSYAVTVTLRDSAGATDTETFTITVSAAVPGIRSSNFNIWICFGDYTNNCNVGTAPAKEGIVDMFWSQARFGLEDFTQSAAIINPNIGAGTCIPASPKENFLTGIENATPVGDATLMTPLVNGLYKAIDYYKNDTSANCDPFDGAQQCLKNFALVITSGEGADNPDYPNTGTENVFTDATNCIASSTPPVTYNLSNNSCYGYNNDLRALSGKQYVSTYIVNTMGTATCNAGATVSCGTILSEAANAGGGIYYNVTDPTQLRDQLIQAFQDILKRAAAGTAASVLASGEGSGANLIQAIFYPRRRFFNSSTGTYDEIAWIGRVANFWYYVDPFFSSSGIYEDNASSKVLNLTNDNLITLYFDSGVEKTMASRMYDSNSDGTADTAITPDVEFEKLTNLWEAALELWKRDVTPGSGARDKRKIYTTTDGAAFLIGNFSADAVNGDSDNSAVLRPFFDLPATDLDGDGFKDGDLNRDGVVDGTDSSILIRYLHGEDYTTINSSYTWLRTRTVPVDLSVPPDGDTLDAGESPKVWKLGDILSSTPKISSWVQLNAYDSVYQDTTYTSFLSDPAYTGRGMVFAGGNDGMLHAFKLGKLELKWTGQGTYEKAKMTLATNDYGKEAWAFIPKNSLPYLKYIPDSAYCHLYSIDLTPYVFDASIGGAYDAVKTAGDWRTVLIGGMRYGGACKNSGVACTADLNGDAVIDSKDCVNTPVNGNGYSSYFALDVTNQNSPTLLWEFSNTQLGYTTSGPAIVRIGADKTKNGKWFVVFGSGPTGPIDKTSQQFLGNSDQNLRLFVLDLKTGALARTIDTAITSAFAGSMVNSAIDSSSSASPQNYQTDAIYLGYVKKAAAGTWTDGGVGRLFTKEDIDPNNWVWSKVIDGIGPVTSAVTRLQSSKKGVLWLYFGTGRYFYETTTSADDLSTQRTIYGIIEPCYELSGLTNTCTDTVDSGTLSDATLDAALDPSTIATGWKIDLDPAAAGSFGAERVIADPSASTTGLVLYTTFKPYDDVCALGGKTYVWALKHDTGGSPGALLQGVALVQVSTGSIEQVDLSTAFTEKSGRRTASFEGGAFGGSQQIAQPKAVQRTIHIRER